MHDKVKMKRNMQMEHQYSKKQNRRKRKVKRECNVKTIVVRDAKVASGVRE